MLDENDINVAADPAVPETPAKPRTTRTRRTTKVAEAPDAPAEAAAAAEIPHAAVLPGVEVPVAHEAAAGEAEVHLSSFAPKGRTRRPTTRRRTTEPEHGSAAGADTITDPLVAAVASVLAGTPVAPVDGPDAGHAEAAPAGTTARTTRRTRTPRTPAAPGVPEEHPAGDPIGDALSALAHAIADSDDEGEDEAGEITGDDTPARRRRRRRGGRRRHGVPLASTDETEVEAQPQEADETAEIPDDTPETAATHRRRRRRRRGEEVDTGTEEDAEVIVRVRDPRETAQSNVTGIDGSTRVEAKKQRRREGRAASRRRAPILSEAEFLARRESVERKMLIRQREEYSQIAVVEDGMLVEHYVDRASATSLIGNIYLGKVQNVLPGMEAAFIDIGRGRNAVLYAGEVDWDSFGDSGKNRKIEDVFSAGQMVVVQVSKDPVGAKGARLTSHISIPGRYVVYAPKGHISGISRKLSEIERVRLKTILDSLVDAAASVVIRTAAEGAAEEELIRDVNRLKAQWEVIEKKSGGKQGTQLLYAEPDLTMRIVRDLFTEDFTAMIVDGNGGMEDAFDTVQAYVQHVAPHLADRIQRWDHQSAGDLFAQYRIDEQIAKALDRKVYLPSGGSLVIDRTEAMTVIDVNTGKFTGAGGNLEATVTSNNLEAAEEIVRQLRLRDIGGIIIIDFIDMVLPSNRELLLRRLVECLGRDRTRHQVSEVTSLGLVQLTRKKVGTGLAEAFTKACDVCDGMGHLRYDEPVDTQAPADGGERHPIRRSRRRS